MSKYQTLKFLFAVLLFIIGGIVFIFGVGWFGFANKAKDYAISALLLLAATALMGFYAIDQLTGFFSGNHQLGFSFRVKAWCIVLLPTLTDLLCIVIGIYRYFHRK